MTPSCSSDLMTPEALQRITAKALFQHKVHVAKSNMTWSSRMIAP